MPGDHPHLGESASVQVTPAPAAPADPNVTPTTPPEETPIVSNKPAALLQKLTGLLGVLLLATMVACTPSPGSISSPTTESAGLNDDASVSAVQRPSWVPAGVPFVHTSDDTHPVPTWHAHLDVAKCLGQVALCDASQAYEVVSADHNLLMTAGATALWNGLSTAGLATPFSTTNAQLAVGDGSTAPAVGNTDLSAALGTKLNAADCASQTGTPIVVTCTLSPAAVAGQVYALSGFGGANAANINQTFEATATSSGSQITLLNSTGGTITMAGGIIQPVNKYRQQANASGSAVVTNNQIVYVATFGTTNANFAWNEWGVTTGAAATNKQAAPPPTILNRATPGGGLGTKTSAASWTLTVTLSLS